MIIEDILKEYPKKIVIKNGEEAILRPLQKYDAERLFQFFKEGIEEEELALLKDNVKDPNTISRWCRDIHYERVFPLVAEKNSGEIIGDATLHMRDFGWAKFIGKIRFAVNKNYRNLGVGSAMIRELIEVAKKLNLDKLWAEVVSTQNAAQKALERLGFEKAGTIPKLAKDYQGNTHDVYIYILDIWQQEY